MIKIADDGDKLAECFPVIVQLRPHLTPETFIEKVLMQTVQNYRIAYNKVNDKVVAVAGFRLARSLAWGEFLYVDDLITDQQECSKGYGKQMLDWLINHAKENGCQQLHLDSGIQRKHAHRFYEREGMTFASHHYSLEL